VRERTYGDEVCGERKRAEQRKGEENMGGWKKSVAATRLRRKGTKKTRTRTTATHC